MARRSGIFGRKSRQRDDSAGETVRVQEFFDQESEELERALDDDGPPVDHEQVDYSITEDWEMPSAVRHEPPEPTLADEAKSDREVQSDTGEWLAQPFRRRETSLLAPERPGRGPAPGGDTGEQIRIAATGAAQQAEIRATDEIVALERDLERAKSSATAELEELEASLRAAELRAVAAEETAAGLAAEREEFEERAREAAKRWLRARIVELKAEARKKIRAEVERLRAEAETPAAEGDAALATSGEADVQKLIEGETDELRRLHARELAEVETRAEVARREDRDRAVDELERRLQEAATDPDERQRELAEARAEAESAAAQRIARIESDADERLRSEVAIARRAAEERFAEKLEARERDLERERETKIELIEDSDRRLSLIEARANEAVAAVASAEEHLAAEAEQLRADSAKRLSEEADHLRAASLKERQEEVEQDLRSIRDRLEREQASRADAVAEAERRVEAAEELAKRTEAESQAGAHRARLAASNWLRGEARALRREGERAARNRNGHPPDDGAKQAIEDARSEVEGRVAAERRSWDEERARLSAELAAARLEVDEMEARTADAAERAKSESSRSVESGAREQRMAEAESKVDDAAWRAKSFASRFRDSRSGFGSGPVLEDAPEVTSTEPKDSDDGTVSLAGASLEALIAIGMSQTQARRVIRYRDERGLSSVRALGDVPGFPRVFLDRLGGRLVD